MPEKENPSGIDFNIPFAEHLGVTGYRQKNGEAEISLQLKPEHLNSWGSAHGGVILGVFDILMGLSAKSMDVKASGAITIELKTNFLRTVNHAINACARATRCGRTLIFVEAEIFNEDGQLAAKASGTFKLKYSGE
jgi:uncharacterized protein (TIGR00369 family)